MCPGDRDGIRRLATITALGLLAALAERGLNWLFIEGGGFTVSRFLERGLLDRLQVTISPVIIGSGRPGIQLPEIGDLSQALRPRTRRFDLGNLTRSQDGQNVHLYASPRVFDVTRALAFLPVIQPERGDGLERALGL